MLVDASRGLRCDWNLWMWTCEVLWWLYSQGAGVWRSSCPAEDSEKNIKRTFSSLQEPRYQHAICPDVSKSTEYSVITILRLLRMKLCKRTGLFYFFSMVVFKLQRESGSSAVNLNHFLLTLLIHLHHSPGNPEVNLGLCPVLPCNRGGWRCRIISQVVCRFGLKCWRCCLRKHSTVLAYYHDVWRMFLFGS